MYDNLFDSIFHKIFKHIFGLLLLYYILFKYFLDIQYIFIEVKDLFIKSEVKGIFKQWSNNLIARFMYFLLYVISKWMNSNLTNY